MTTPSREWLAKSKREHNVPEHWDWTFCAGGCGQVVWYDPAAKSASLRLAKFFRVVCSSTCALTMIQEHRNEQEVH